MEKKQGNQESSQKEIRNGGLIAPQSVVSEKSGKIASNDKVDGQSGEENLAYTNLGCVDDFVLMLDIDAALGQAGSASGLPELAGIVNELRENSIPPKREVKSSVLGKKIVAIEKNFFGEEGGSLFHRRSGASSEANTSGHWQRHQEPEAAALADRALGEIQRFLQGIQYVRISQQTPTIHIGCSPTPTHLVEKACQDFHTYKKKPRCQIIIHNDMPQVLRREGNGLGKYDIVVASCSDTSLIKTERQKIGSVMLEPQLLIPRRHRLAKKLKISWMDLDGWLILVPSDSRWPRPTLPHTQCPSGIRQQQFDHYREALATVRAAGDDGTIACVACTELHADEDLKGLRSFPMDGFEMTVELGAFRYNDSTSTSSPIKDNLVKELSQHIGEQLSSLQASIHNLSKQPPFPNGWMAIYHVKRVRGEGGKSKLVWIPGRLKHLSVRPSGEFEAEHLIIDRLEKKQDFEYPITGQLFRSDNGITQLTWTGKIVEEDSTYEEGYSCSFLFGRKTLSSDSPIVGFWSGVTTNHGKPDAGYMILLPLEYTGFSSRYRGIQELNEIVRNYRHKGHFDNLGLQLPEIPTLVEPALQSRKPR